MWFLILVSVWLGLEQIDLFDFGHGANAFCYFCSFICADFEIGDHSPVTCKDLDRWRQKASDESESIKYIKAHTKL
jgi:hypothetical protein